MTFKVKLDTPIILAIVLIVAVLAVPVFLYFPSVISALFAIFIALVVFGCLAFSYKLTEKCLVVRFGIFGWSFRLDAIKALIPLKKPYRFKLVYGRNSCTYLSVDNPDAFFKALQAEIDKRALLRAHAGQQQL